MSENHEEIMRIIKNQQDSIEKLQETQSKQQDTIKRQQDSIKELQETQSKQQGTIKKLQDSIKELQEMQSKKQGAIKRKSAIKKPQDSIEELQQKRRQQKQEELQKKRRQQKELELSVLGGSVSLADVLKTDNKEMLMRLLDKGMDVNAEVEDGWSALHIAARNGSTGCVRVLLKKGANAKATVSLLLGWGCTPLHIAVQNGHMECVRVLSDTRADMVNAKDHDGLTPLHHAARNGHTECVRILSGKGTDVVNVKDRNGWTPLHHAAEKGHTESVRVLLENGAKVDEKDFENRTALYMAAHCGHAECVRVLLEYRANVHEKDFFGKTALDIALKNNNQDCVKILETANKISGANHVSTAPLAPFSPTLLGPTVPLTTTPSVSSGRALASTSHSVLSYAGSQTSDMHLTASSSFTLSSSPISSQEQGGENRRRTALPKPLAAGQHFFSAHPVSTSPSVSSGSALASTSHSVLSYAGSQTSDMHLTASSSFTLSSSPISSQEQGRKKRRRTALPEPLAAGQDFFSADQSPGTGATDTGVERMGGNATANIMMLANRAVPDTTPIKEEPSSPLLRPGSSSTR